MEQSRVEFLDLLNRFEQVAIANAKWGYDFQEVSRLYAAVRVEMEDAFFGREERIRSLEATMRAALEGTNGNAR